MSQFVRRVPRGLPAEGVELTEARLTMMIDALHATADPADRRTAARLPIEGFVDIALVTPGAPPRARRAGVYDLSRTGVAIVDVEPIEAGRQFNMLIPRPARRPIEVLCLARYCRAEGQAFVIGAQFGVSWLSAVGAAVIPPRPQGWAPSVNLTTAGSPVR